MAEDDEKEIAKRRDDVIRRMLSTPPAPKGKAKDPSKRKAPKASS